MTPVIIRAALIALWLGVAALVVWYCNREEK